MANKTIPELTELAAPASGDYVPVYDSSSGGEAKRTSLGNLLDIKPAASDTEAGYVELATISETTTGTDATRAVTPAGLKGITSVNGFVWVKDEDAMTSDSELAVPTQQSVKAYADTKVSLSAAISQRINPRTTTEASSATPTINTDNTDIHTITALAVAITSMTSGLSGTPVNGQRLTIRIKDNGTARAIAWGASFASRGATLPTTTVLSKYLYVGFMYNSTASVWDCIATSQEV